MFGVQGLVLNRLVFWVHESVLNRLVVWVQGSVLHHLVLYVHNGVQDSILQRLVFGMLKIHELLISKKGKETFGCGKSDGSA